MTELIVKLSQYGLNQEQEQIYAEFEDLMAIEPIFTIV